MLSLVPDTRDVTLDAAAGSCLSAGLPIVHVDGLALHAVREQECVAHVVRELSAGRGGFIATANVDHMVRLRRSPEFQRVYAQATLVVADGVPLLWASRLQGAPLPERVAGSDLIHSLSRAAAAAGRRVLLLGGNPGTAEQAAQVLKCGSPDLIVADALCPPFGFEQDPAYVAELRQAIRDSRAELVFVGLGSPKQELFIAQHRDVLPNAWWIGVGISFSFVSGEVTRAPRWVQRIGCEWLHRLVQEPRRLWTRYLVRGLPFAAGLLARAAWRRLRGGARA